MRKEITIKNRDRFIELGITIGYVRRLRGLTQEQLAEKANISRTHLSLIEAPNVIKGISLDALYNIADALEVEPGDLLNSKFPK
ncbi:MAG: helix-turn-helix transcriptional regulator [Clostridia bacterium]|nr:helix-turn-helix transcriptional regulator [Clostridia bacterium]